MNETKEITIKTPVSTTPVYIPNETDWKFMIAWGAQALRSGMLPSGIKSAEAAAIIVLKGRELGLSFMTAVAHIHVISGKPSMSAELMQAMARKNLPGLKIVVVKADAQEATVKFLRPEEGSEWFFSSFSMEDAKRAELTRNPSWAKYPKAMLWSRAVSAGLRIVCPEALMGVSYTPEELGAHVDEGGNVIETTSRPLSSSEHSSTASQMPVNAKKEPSEREKVIPISKSNSDPSHASNEKSPKVAVDIAAEVIGIRNLQKELKMSEDEFKDVLHQNFKTDTMKGLSIEQLKEFRHLLEMELESYGGSFDAFPSHLSSPLEPLEPI